MSHFNVRKDDMDFDGMLAELTDDEVEDLLSGRFPREEHEALFALIEALRSAKKQAEPRVDPELASAFAFGLPADDSPLPAWATLPEPEPAERVRSWPRRARWRARPARALAALSTLLSTLVGKIVFSAAIAAASVGGGHAAGVVDVPGLPDPAPKIDAGEVVPGGASEAEEADEPGTGAVSEPGKPDEPANGGASEVAEPGARQPDAEDAEDVQREPGVDGGEVSDRATSGEPQEDGEAFGRSTADEATEGTPADPGGAGSGKAPKSRDDAPGRSGEKRPEHSYKTPAADEQRPNRAGGRNKRERSAGARWSSRTGGRSDRERSGGARWSSRWGDRSDRERSGGTRWSSRPGGARWSSRPGGRRNRQESGSRVPDEQP